MVTTGDYNNRSHIRIFPSPTSHIHICEEHIPGHPCRSITSYSVHCNNILSSLLPVPHKMGILYILIQRGFLLSFSSLSLSALFFFCFFGPFSPQLQLTILSPHLMVCSLAKKHFLFCVSLYVCKPSRADFLLLEAHGQSLSIPRG